MFAMLNSHKGGAGAVTVVPSPGPEALLQDDSEDQVGRDTVVADALDALGRGFGTLRKLDSSPGSTSSVTTCSFSSLSSIASSEIARPTGAGDEIRLGREYGVDVGDSRELDALFTPPSRPVSAHPVLGPSPLS